MLLFIAYPSVSQKIFRLYQCDNVEGVSYLVSDMRVRCYTREWFAYALYAGVMCALYVIGFPLSIAIILVRRRRVLFGEGSAETRRVYGFLYEAYGPSAWWWEVEELLRKLFLSAVVVFVNPGSPLQVTMAVLISGWAHVLHAVYKPWGVGHRTYLVQHGSLFVTSFVFLMGLLFKVQSVDTTSAAYTTMSVTMLLLCVGFVVWWFCEMAGGVIVTLRARGKAESRGAVFRRFSRMGSAVELPSASVTSSLPSTVEGDSGSGSHSGHGSVSSGATPLLARTSDAALPSALEECKGGESPRSTEVLNPMHSGGGQGAAARALRVAARLPPVMARAPDAVSAVHGLAFARNSVSVKAQRAKGAAE
jgi:hypothetical protein